MPIKNDRRNLKGSWGQPKNRLRWPNGAGLAVSFVVNVEEGAELSVGDGDERNESLYEIREEVIDAPDLCMESHFGYGPRRGYQRIVDAFDRHGVTATFSTNGRAALRLPWLLQDAVQRGHEISAHGWRWERHAGMLVDEERAVIERTYQSIKKVAGVSPVGWHTRSSTSVQTRELLVAHGGFAYDSDAYDDDSPWQASVLGQTHVVLPYAFDTNDMRFAPGAGFVHADDFYRYVVAAFEQLLIESRDCALMLSIGLHLRTIGRPARIGGLHRVLEHFSKSGNVWLATRQDIATAWRVQMGLDPWILRNKETN